MALERLKILSFAISVLGFVCILFSSVTATEFKECKGVPSPTVFEFVGCPVGPCPFVKGQTFNITFVFTPDEDHDDVLFGFQATVADITQGFPGIDGKNTCERFYNVEDNAKGCPLKKGQTYRHELVLPFKVPAPKLTVMARLFLKDKKTKKDFVCVNVPVQTGA